jgi:hypothetical protein
MAKALNERDMDQITKTTGEVLAAQPKVKVRLPINSTKKKELEAQLEAGKKVDWPFETVQINGYTFQIQLGQTVEVPESVAAILEDAGMI